jgi:hypothetical protein
MRKEQLAGDAVPAVIIPVVQLPLNGYESPKTHAALSAPAAFECCHAGNRSLA